MRNLTRAVWGARVGLSALAATRLTRGRRRHEPLRAVEIGDARVSVVIPARDEARRIEPCLDSLRGAPGVGEVIVVDDHSSDATAALARAAGARVLTAAPLPAGWVGKSWALEHGLRAAAHDVVVFLDADVIVEPGLIGALLAALGDAEYVSVGARFRCDTAGERWLHPAMLATLVYRYGPPDARRSAPSRRLLVNGQCVAVRRDELLAAGAFAAARDRFADDAALARDLARRGWRIAFRDGGGLLLVDMHESMAQTWREWGRTIALADVDGLADRLLDLALVWAVLAAPPLRLLAGRADRLDAGLLLTRAGMLVATAGSYERRGLPFWASMTADPAAAVALTRSALRPSRSWRGRVYPSAGRTAPRSGS